MLTEPRRYLENIRTRLRLEPSSRKEVLCELYTHLEDEVEELEEAGLSEEEATRIVAESFGPITAVADELNEVHNSNNWVQTTVAALPHLIFALLFAFHQWSNAGWLMITVLSTVGVAIYGWQHNKPTWFFTWLGYALIPLLVIGFFLLEQALGRNSFASSWWVWAVILVYLPVVLWLFIHILVQALRRDWLLGSLMVLPVPPMIGWFMTAQWKEELLGEGKHTFHSLEPWIALSFLTLAGMVVLFTRLQQRHLKAGVLLISGIASLVYMTFSSGGSIGFLHVVVLALIILFLLLGPALLEHKITNEEAEPWDYLVGHHPRG